MDIDVINEFTLHVRSRKNKRAERAVLWLAKRPLQSIVLRDGIFWCELAGENYSIPKYVKELANQFMAEQYDAEYSGLYFLSKSA